MKSQSSKVPKELQGERVDVCAAQIFTEISRKKIKAIIDNGGAFLNKKRISMAKQPVSAGDLLELFWEEASALKQTGAKELTDKDVLIDTPDFLVVAKPAGVVSQATLASSLATMAHLIASSFAGRFKIENLLLVHRLDRETSGAMIFAKNRKVQSYFEELFVRKEMQKTYDAICFYGPKKASGVIEFPIAKDGLRKNTYRAVLNQPKVGIGATNSTKKGAEVRSAVTRYAVIKAYSKSNVSHLQAFPETGRTHQIRVHFQAEGCPLIGDKTYANGVIGHVFGQRFLRHLLHASSLRFVGPDGAKYAVECPFPQDFLECLALLESRELK